MPPTRAKSFSYRRRSRRSHEENQERAYIAASRRSDRCLEARVESARRASDIHRDLTGRFLRVTEEDVLKNEEYEEIVELPSAHLHFFTHSNANLQSQSAEMNRRLLAHLTSQIAIRAALNKTTSRYRTNYQAYATGQIINPEELQCPVWQQLDAQIFGGLPAASAASHASSDSSPWDVALDDGQIEHYIGSRAIPQPSSSPPAHSYHRTGYSPESVSLYEKFISSDNDVVNNDFWQEPSAQSNDRLTSYQPEDFLQQPAMGTEVQPDQSNDELRSLCCGGSPNEQLHSPLSTVLPLEQQQILASDPFCVNFNGEIFPVSRSPQDF